MNLGCFDQQTSLQNSTLSMLCICQKVKIISINICIFRKYICFKFVINFSLGIQLKWKYNEMYLPESEALVYVSYDVDPNERKCELIKYTCPTNTADCYFYRSRSGRYINNRQHNQTDSGSNKISKQRCSDYEISLLGVYTAAYARLVINYHHKLEN